MKTLKKNRLFTAMMLVCLGMTTIDLFGQNRILKTERDGFQWYLCSNNEGEKWVEFKGGNKLTKPLWSHQIDWERSGYVESHKVFYIRNTSSSPECLAAPSDGGLYSTQGELLTRGSWSPFHYSFRDHGIIISSDYGKSGVYYNDKVIIPFGSSKYYDIIYVDDCYIASTSKYQSKYDIFSNDGVLIESGVKEYKIVEDKLFVFIDGDTYNKSKQRIAKGKIVETYICNSGETYFKTIDSKSGRYGVFSMSGNEILPNQFNWLAVDSDNLVVKVRTSDYKYGMYGIDGSEILASEFEDCDYLNNNLFKFKMNGYWGVMNRQGKIIIPLSRQYTQIDYSRTLKTFTFVKEGGYKGECNANGVQTSIVKMKEDKSVVSATTNSNKNNTNSKTSNTTSETSNSKKSAKVEDGLLFEGDYTEGPWINPNTGYSQPAPNSHHHIKIYEDHIVIDMLNLSCSGKSSSGEKMFVNSWSNITYYVDNSFNIRSTFPYGYSQFTKGNVVYDMNAPVQNYDDGDYNGGTKGTNGDYKGGQTRPSTKDCPVCHTTGNCQTCLGRGWVTGLDNQRHDCPTCHGNKVCWKCNGSGKVSTH